MNIFSLSKKGFTLIELLVVIAIIGLLASTVMASLSSARVRARDTKRITELKSLQNAIEMYYSRTGHYPNDGLSGTFASCWRPGSNWFPDGANYDWSVGYISKQPADPIDNCCWPWGNTGCGVAGEAGTYEYWSNGSKYMFAARLEDISSRYRAEITNAIDPRSGLPYANNGPLGKYTYVISN